MIFIKKGNPASPHPVCGAGRWRVCTDRYRGTDRCVKIILNSYGIVVALVSSLYYSLFLKKKTTKKTNKPHRLKCLPSCHVLHSDQHQGFGFVFSAHDMERGLYLSDVQWNVSWLRLCCTESSGHMLTASQGGASANECQMWQSEHLQWRLCECKVPLSLPSAVLHQLKQLNSAAITNRLLMHTRAQLTHKWIFVLLRIYQVYTSAEN